MTSAYSYFAVLWRLRSQGISGAGGSFVRWVLLLNVRSPVARWCTGWALTLALMAIVTVQRFRSRYL